MKYLSTNLYAIVICTFLCASFPDSLESQNNLSKANTYTWFDEIVGTTNSGIFEGTEYFERYKRTNERHQYFKTNKFMRGSVWYDGQSYYNIPVKYDVFDEKFLVQDPNTLNAPIIELAKNKINAFTIGNHKFTHIHNDNNEKITGFFEILLELELISLFKQHKKEIIRRSDEKVAYLDKQVASYQFKDKFNHVVRYNGINYYVKKIKDLNAIFDAFKPQLKLIYKEHKALKKSNPDAHMMAILRDLHAIINAQNNTIN